MSLSSESAQALRFFREAEFEVPDDKLPPWLSVDRRDFLVNQGFLVRFLLLTPDKEPEYYPHGLNAFRITPAGLDALEEFERQQEEEARNRREKKQQEARQSEQARKDRHHDYFVSAFEVLLGFLIGLVAEHYGQLVAFLLDLFGIHR